MRRARCGTVADGVTEDEGLAAQAAPRLTGRGVDAQPVSEFGFVGGEGGVAAPPAGLQSEIHAETGYGFGRGDQPCLPVPPVAPVLPVLPVEPGVPSVRVPPPAALAVPAAPPFPGVPGAPP